MNRSGWPRLTGSPRDGWAQVEVAEEFRVTCKTASCWCHAWELKRDGGAVGVWKAQVWSQV
ncbi:hypothetical protein FDG2_4125 [Candidatus Protofrankia californiensis]|uniref:Uncharacterized protein n=1 Tax=Candidatus Protofrankia californiensis TaxID=1839754 RepID=A0A1C3P3H2_9ACTN|nr:hypothetical protein FDG2_4125 [Candidatus Protofrankia californiensis]